MLPYAGIIRTSNKGQHACVFSALGSPSITLCDYPDYTPAEGECQDKNLLVFQVKSEGGWKKLSLFPGVCYTNLHMEKKKRSLVGNGKNTAK